MQRIMFAVYLFCFLQAYAKTPIPEALLNAKTAFVTNARAEDKDFAKLCEALKEWGRFELVQDRASADIVISLFTNAKTRYTQMPAGLSTYGGRVRVISAKVLINCISIINTQDGTLLWSDETSVDFPKDLKRLVKNLKNKMKKK